MTNSREQGWLCFGLPDASPQNINLSLTMNEDNAPAIPAVCTIETTKSMTSMSEIVPAMLSVAADALRSSFEQIRRNYVLC
jgi:hypothetical protein